MTERNLALTVGWGGDADTDFLEHVLKYLTTEGKGTGSWGTGSWNIEVTTWRFTPGVHYGALTDYRRFTGRSGDSVPAIVIVPLDPETGEDTGQPEVVIRLSDISRLIIP
jgi:hypothetical protein